MKKHLLPIIILLMIAVAGFGTSFAITKPKHVDAHKHSGTTSASIAQDKSIMSQKADKNVDLRNDKASPDQVTLKVGQVLQFNAKDTREHRLALGEGGSEHEHTSKTDSSTFGKDEAWRVRFDNPGTYFIHDHLSPNISVLVVVYRAQ